jgi:uncharacterized protein (DUF2345 family)
VAAAGITLTAPKVKISTTGDADATASGKVNLTSTDDTDITASGNVNLTGTKYSIAGLSSYANNAAALAAGLTAGQLYRNGDNLGVVH